MSHQYKMPPLREAVCEFRFPPDSPWDLTFPGLIYAELRDEFPVKLPGKEELLSATVTIEPGGTQQLPLQSEEVRFWRDENTGVIRIIPRSISVSHYKPYPSWQGFLPVVQKAFDAYTNVASPEGLQRVGLRYINEITFEQPSVELEEYFNFYPFTGDELPDDYGAFITRIHYPYNGGRDVLRVQLSTGNVVTAGKLPILLDLDYFLTTPRGIGFDQISEWLEEAHTHIEEVFEGCLKDSLRRRFEEESG